MNIQNWITKHYRHDRLGERGKDYENAVRKSHENDFAEYGYDVISRYESNTGFAVWYPDYETAKKLMKIHKKG